jgi:hypothetical protein
MGGKVWSDSITTIGLLSLVSAFVGKTGEGGYFNVTCAKTLKNTAPVRIRPLPPPQLYNGISHFLWHMVAYRYQDSVKTSYVPFRYIAVAIRPLSLQMWIVEARGGALVQYTSSTSLLVLQTALRVLNAWFI